MHGVINCCFGLCRASKVPGVVARSVMEIIEIWTSQAIGLHLRLQGCRVGSKLQGSAKVTLHYDQPAFDTSWADPFYKCLR